MSLSKSVIKKVPKLDGLDKRIIKSRRFGPKILLKNKKIKK